jgi:hypothetical protein
VPLRHRFNYVGDTTWFDGTVVGRRIVEGVGPVVDLEITGRNQRGDVNTVAQATVLLASRQHGPVVLPEPPNPPAEVGPRRDVQGGRRAR